jgi:hypothetical protein
MSSLSLITHRHDGENSRRRLVLAVHEMRRGVERVAIAKPTPRRAPMEVIRTPTVRELQELSAALDRRTPQESRLGETAIANDAAALKARALKRIAELEAALASAEFT